MGSLAFRPHPSRPVGRAGQSDQDSPDAASVIAKGPLIDQNHRPDEGAIRMQCVGVFSHSQLCSLFAAAVGQHGLEQVQLAGFDMIAVGIVGESSR